ncbi:MAG: acyltransferase [Clostridia bacterium]|nr:acyltransferase [Clostridia bacterium]
MAETTILQNNRLLGVEILRFYMAFMVVATHFGGHLVCPAESVLYIFEGFHVAVFMLLSFMLCGKYFLEPTKALVTKRVVRIVFPLVVWGIIGFLVSLCFYPDLSFETLCWQLCTGHTGVNSPLWFLAVMLWISLLFWIIRLICCNKKPFLIVIVVLAVVCIVLQYTGLNYAMFGGLPYELKYPLGRLIEMIPYASVGVCFSMLLPLIKVCGNKKQTIIFVVATLLVGLCVFLHYFYGDTAVPGFGYNGAYMLVVAFLLTAIACTIPLNFIKNQTFNNIIVWLCSFTMGVFCMHAFVGRVIEQLFVQLGFETNTIVICLAIYVVCYIVSLLIYFIPSKYTKMLVR